MSLPGKRIVVLMIDGFGLDYFERSPMPHLGQMARAGFYKPGRCVFPSLTNANNISIACGCWPDEHGVTTNSYFDESTGRAEFLEDASFLCAPTIFDRARAEGVRSALLTCKAKTALILGAGLELAVAAEAPAEDVVRRFGRPPGMYSSEVNYWLCAVALQLLKERPEIGLVYVHTTDYPMHMWPPDAFESLAHLSRLDECIGRMRAAAPDAIFIITADHGMNRKKRCWDLGKACARRGLPLRFAVSPIADRLIKHHRGFGGVSYVYLEDPAHAEAAAELIGGLPGVEEVIPRASAAARFRLMPGRIGDLVVLPDVDTVFGDLPAESEALEPGYRSHGSLYEMEIPLVYFDPAGETPPSDRIDYNLDLTRSLFAPAAD
jgi:phosphonoacetate hydrolase